MTDVKPCKTKGPTGVLKTLGAINVIISFLVTNPLAGQITAVICVACATFSAIGGLRAIVAIGIGTTFLALAGTALPTGLALIPMGFSKMWEIASVGSRLVFYE